MPSPRPASPPARTRERSASSASACAPMRRLPTAIAWRSTGRCCSSRRNGGASAPRGAVNLSAPVGDRFLLARDLAVALLVVQVNALARRIHATQALAALELAQARLCRVAVGTLLLRFGVLLRCFLLGLRTLLLAFLERLLGRERLVFARRLLLRLRRGCGRARRAW